MSNPVGTESGTGSTKKTQRYGRQLALHHMMAFLLHLPFGPS